MKLWVQLVRTLFVIWVSWAVIELITIITTDGGFLIYADDVIRDAGYPCEAHKVLTEDGYILTVFRIPHGKGQEPGRRPAILLLHGFTANSDSFLHPSTEKGLAFVLADNGYDVWLGNTRGGRYSIEHVNTTNIDKEKYWDFSFHELGYYDTPAMVSHILNVTKEEKIYLLGHSLGFAVATVFLSTRTEFQDKIQAAIALGPAVFIGRGTSVLINNWCKIVQPPYAMIYGSHFFPPPRINKLKNYLRLKCSSDFIISYLCNYVYRLSNGPSSGSSEGRFEALMAYIGTTISMKTSTHLCQSINTGYFRPYDYGEKLNLVKYGSSEPPNYELRNITTPIVIFQADGDAFVHAEDSYQLCTSFRRVVEFYRVPEPVFNHLDFILHENVKSLVYDKLLELMNQGKSLMNRKAHCQKPTVNN